MISALKLAHMGGAGGGDWYCMQGFDLIPGSRYFNLFCSHDLNRWDQEWVLDSYKQCDHAVYWFALPALGQGQRSRSTRKMLGHRKLLEVCVESSMSDACFVGCVTNEEIIFAQLVHQR